MLFFSPPLFLKLKCEKRFEYIYTTLTLHKYRNNNYCTKYQQSGNKGVGFTTEKCSKPGTQNQMVYRMWKLKSKTKQVIKSDPKVVRYCCGRCPLPCRKAPPMSGTQFFQRVTVSNSRAEDENLTKPLQLSLLPLRGRSLVHEGNTNTWRWRCSERMEHSEQNFRGRPCIMPPVSHRPAARLKASHLKWADFLDNFVCWNLPTAQSSWYYKFAIWGTIYY